MVWCRAVFLQPVLEYPSPAHFVCLPRLSHLIQLIMETVRPEVGVSDIGTHMCAVLGERHGEV